MLANRSVNHVSRTVVVHINLDRVADDRQGRRSRYFLNQLHQSRSFILVEDHNGSEDCVEGDSDGREIGDALDDPCEDHTLSN